MNLKAQEASVQSLKEQVTAAQADLNSAVARTNQATAAQSTVASTRAQVENATAQLKASRSSAGIHEDLCASDRNRAGARGARRRSGECGAGDRYRRGFQRHVGVRGDSRDGRRSYRIRRHAAGTAAGRNGSSGKVFYKAAEADFATQRDVGRRKRDIRTIALKVRLDNPKGAYVPGMTAEVLVPSGATEGDGRSRRNGS